MPASLTAAIPALPALLLGFFLMQTGNTFQGTILSIRGEIEGFTLAQIGAVGAGFWAGVIIGSLCAARVIRRVGHIRTFAAFGAIAGAAPLVHLLVVNPFVWMATRALTGFCFAAMFIVIESWLNAGASSENRGQVLSIYGMTGLLAGICGQLLLPTTDPGGFRPFCIIACIISVALVPIALTQGAAPAPPGERSHVGLRPALPRLAFGRRGRILERRDNWRLLHPRSNFRRTAGSEHRSDRCLHGVRYAWRVCGGLAPRIAFGSPRPAPRDYRGGRRGGCESCR